jgi:hypothetical protein
VEFHVSKLVSNLPDHYYEKNKKKVGDLSSSEKGFKRQTCKTAEKQAYQLSYSRPYNCMVFFVKKNILRR